MAVKVIDRAYVTIDGVEFDCATVTVKAEMSGHGPVETMNRLNRAKSFKSGVPVFTLSADIPINEGDHEIDFWQMMFDQTYFTTTLEYQDGTSRNIYDCTISSIEENPSSGEGTTTKLEISGLDYGKN